MSTVTPRAAQPKKPLSEMTSEEKDAWLAERKEQARVKREREAREAAIQSEKNRVALGRAAMDLKEKEEARQAEMLAARKRREQAEAAAHKFGLLLAELPHHPTVRLIDVVSSSKSMQPKRPGGVKRSVSVSGYDECTAFPITVSPMQILVTLLLAAGETQASSEMR